MLASGVIEGEIALRISKWLSGACFLLLISAVPRDVQKSSALVPCRRNASVFHVGGDVRPPLVRRHVEPLLPEEIRHGTPEPFILLELQIDACGEVQAVRVLRSNAPSLHPYVIPAIQKWTFQPATRRGVPVSVYYTLSVRYEVR